jgi:hypothetical protein
MKRITVDDVVRAVHERAARADDPLAEDTDDIPEGELSIAEG